jgi:hypothetical protein
MQFVALFRKDFCQSFHICNESGQAFNSLDGILGDVGYAGFGA